MRHFRVGDEYRRCSSPHDPTMAAAADRVVHVRDGRVVEPDADTSARPAAGVSTQPQLEVE
jgi:hypothetical protein